MAWAIGNVMMETDANANIKPNKKKAANKIDPAVAFLMSFGNYLLEYGEIDINLSDEQKQAVYEFKKLNYSNNYFALFILCHSIAISSLVLS